MSGGDALCRVVIDIRRLRRMHDTRDDRLAARRQPPDRRDIKIAEDRQRQRPRDRRRRHHQRVRDRLRVGRLGPECRALVDTETVLLVDHDDGETLEADGLRQQGVGADQEIDLARREPLEDGAALGRSLRAGQQLDRDARARQHLADRGVVLLGQQLRGRHQRGLVAGGDRHEHGIQRDHRLAGADVALQQAVHGPLACQIIGDIVDRGTLAARQLEWESRRDVLVDRRVVLERDR